MNIQESASNILARLKRRYPEAKTALNWKNPWQLLVATVLSAQCTDKQVNKITPGFFQKWATPHDLALASVAEVEEVIRSAGFYRNKSRNLVGAAKVIVSQFNGKVPDSMKDLLSLPGIARKSANVILASAYKINEGIAVDTHVRRIAYRLGLTQSSSPAVIEKDLMLIFQQSDWADINFMLVYFGREVCKARKPACDNCELSDICVKNGV